MLIFKSKPGIIKTNAINSTKVNTRCYLESHILPNIFILQRGKERNVFQNGSSAPLPERLIAAICPVLSKKILRKEQELCEKEAALDRKMGQLQNEKAAWKAATIAQDAKQARVKEGAAIMFKANRLQMQLEKEEQAQTVKALENGLYQATQKELDALVLERDHITAVFLTIAMAQSVAAAAALKAQARADTISNQLTRSLLQVEKIQERANVRLDELDILISAAKGDRTELRQRLEKAQAQVARFNVAIGVIEITQGQIGTKVAVMGEDCDPHYRSADKEQEEALGEVRMAKDHARVKQSRVAVEMENQVVKKELERARLLGIMAERERAASVDAKKTVPGELQAAVMMREESKRTGLSNIADALAISTQRSNPIAANITLGEVLVDGHTSKMKGGCGRTSRLECYEDYTTRGQLRGQHRQTDIEHIDHSINGDGLKKRTNPSSIPGNTGLLAPLGFMLHPGSLPTSARDLKVHHLQRAVTDENVRPVFLVERDSIKKQSTAKASEGRDPSMGRQKRVELASVANTVH